MRPVPSSLQSERSFRLLVDSTRDYALFMLDPEGIVRTWNKGAERLKGWTADEIIGKSFTTFYPPEAAHRPAEELRIAAAEGRVEDVGWRLRKDGSRFFARVVITALRDDEGRLLGFGKATVDLTELAAATARAGAAERDLRQSQDACRAIIDSVTDYAIFMLDAEGYIRTWNPGAERLKGWRADEIIGKSFATFYPEEDLRAGKPANELRIAAAAGRVEDQGWRLRKDGTRFFARVVISAIRDGQGRLVGFSKVTNDITEAKTRAERELDAERALRDSREAFRLLVDSVNDYAIFMLDPDGRVLTWNRGAERLKGYAASEIIGQHFSVFYGADDVRAGKPESELERAAREGRVEDQGWRVRKDGSRFFARVVVTALRDETGALRGFAKVTNDVTESYLATERVLRVVNEAATILQAQGIEARLVTVARLTVPDLADACLVDLVTDGTARRLIAVHPDPAVAQALQAVTPALDGAHLIGETLRTGEARIGRDAEVPAPLRALGIRAIACMPLVARGRTHGAITFCSLLAGRYASDALTWVTAFARTASSAVENAALLAEAQQATEEAREAVAIRDAFLSVASHELKTPLNTLQLQVQQFLRTAEVKDDRGRVRLTRVQAQIDKLAALIGSLLDVTRIMSGRLLLDPLETDLAALVRDVLERDGELLRDAQCELRLEADAPVVGRFDRLRIDQTLTNLVSNAVKFGAGKPIRIAVERAGDRARLIVEDQGIGIAVADQGRIFQRFERAVSTRSFGGFGLGLWIVREVVEAHGGTVTVDSAPGRGARFTVELPLQGPPAL
jgi:PAS domain S-box-containing protein